MNRKTHRTIERKAGETMQIQMATAPGDLLTLDELATRLKMHPDTVRRLKREGTIPALVLGHRTLRFSWPDVLASLRQAQATK
jgi:excisionase family DNA binding protein